MNTSLPGWLSERVRRVRSAVTGPASPVRYFVAAQRCRISGIAGGLPVPPRRLTWLVAGHYDVVKSLRNGRRTSENLREALARAGLRLEDFGEILDFGCGSGRVLRNWKSLKTTRVYGTDYNEDSIRWCQRHLRFAEFVRNDLHPPLRWPDETFAFVYACSVFTHLEESLQHAWMRELRRILKPEGHLLFTTHGEMYLKSLSDAERATFLTGQLVVRNGELSGQNACGVYHPAEYVKAHLANGFTVVDHIPEGAVGTGRQDIYLLKKSATSR
jgi:SAM-dependent methyltransferase